MPEDDTAAPDHGFFCSAECVDYCIAGLPSGQSVVDHDGEVWHHHKVFAGDMAASTTSQQMLKLVAATGYEPIDMARFPPAPRSGMVGFVLAFSTAEVALRCVAAHARACVCVGVWVCMCMCVRASR